MAAISLSCLSLCLFWIIPFLSLHIFSFQARCFLHDCPLNFGRYYHKQLAQRLCLDKNTRGKETLTNQPLLMKMLSEKTDNTNSVKGTGINDEGTSLGRVATPQYAPGRHRETGKERSSQPLSRFPPKVHKHKLTNESNYPKHRAQFFKRKFLNWNLGQINVQSCSDDFRLNSILDQCNKANLDIICMQEVRRLGNDSLSHLGYNIYWSGLQMKREQGVAIAIRQSNDIKIDSITHHSARLMAADVTIRGCKIRIISAYAPTEDKAKSTKQ